MAAFSMYLMILLPFLTGISCLKIGAITYWDNPSSYTTLPRNSLAIINPSDGMITATSDDISNFVQIFDKIKTSNPTVSILGYVPTGTGKKQPISRIQSDVTSYFNHFPKLDGIFFDEIDSGCTRAKNDMIQYRGVIKKIRSNALIAFNPGWVGDDWCYLNYTQPGEIIMDFESYFKTYRTKSSKKELTRARQIARDRGIQTWHVVHGVPTQKDMEVAMSLVKIFQPDYIYLAENEQYNKAPNYWEAEKKAVYGSQ